MSQDPDETEAYYQHFKPDLDLWKKLVTTYASAAAAEIDSFKAALYVMAYKQSLAATGAPNTPMRAAFMAMLTQADQDHLTATAAYKSAEAYRKSMLQDDV